MRVDKISYKNFRNIEAAEIFPCRGVTVFTGDNGQGKTNGLEGIYLFARGRSFRTPREREMIRFGEEKSEVVLHFTDKNRSQELSIQWISSSGRRFCKKNGAPIPRMSEFIGAFRAVLFCPQQLAIVNEGPSERRSFLDVAISQLDPVYLSSLQRFYKILAQRNALIKKIRERYDKNISDQDKAMAEILSAQLAAESVIISQKRREYLLKLNDNIKLLFSDMTGGREKPELRYEGEDGEEELYSKLCSSFEREIRYGATLYGAHKDDIQIILDGRDARSYASQGQQRSIALSMKLAEGEISKEKTGEYPVFLFDDIMSELDEGRRNYLTNGIKDRQVIITSCNDIEKAEKIYSVSGGKYAEKT